MNSNDMHLVDKVERETKTARRIAKLLEEYKCEGEALLRVLAYVDNLVGREVKPQ